MPDRVLSGWEAGVRLATKVLLAIVGLVSPASLIPTPRFRMMWPWETVAGEPEQVGAPPHTGNRGSGGRTVCTFAAAENRRVLISACDGNNLDQ